MLSVLHAPVRRCVLVLGGSPPATEIAFFWEAVEEATGYRLQLGTATTLTDVYDSPVGNVLTAYVPLAAGTYFSRTMVMGGAHDGELTDGGEQEFTVA